MLARPFARDRVWRRQHAGGVQQLPVDPQTNRKMIARRTPHFAVTLRVIKSAKFLCDPGAGPAWFSRAARVRPTWRTTRRHRAQSGVRTVQKHQNLLCNICGFLQQLWELLMQNTFLIPTNPILRTSRKREDLTRTSLLRLRRYKCADCPFFKIALILQIDLSTHDAAPAESPRRTPTCTSTDPRRSTHPLQSDPYTQAMGGGSKLMSELCSSAAVQPPKHKVPAEPRSCSACVSALTRMVNL